MGEGVGRLTDVIKGIKIHGSLVDNLPQLWTQSNYQRKGLSTQEEEKDEKRGRGKSADEGDEGWRRESIE